MTKTSAIEIRKLQQLGWLAATLLTLRLADLAIIPLSGLLAHWLRFGGTEPVSHGELLALSFASMLALVVFNLGQAYTVRLAASTWALSVRAIGHWLLVFLLALATAFMFKVSDHFSRIWAGLWLLLAGGGFVAVRAITADLVRRAQREGRLAVRVAILGADQNGLTMVRHLHDDDAVRVIGLYTDCGKQAQAAGLSIAGGFSDLLTTIREGKVDCVVIPLPWSGKQQLHQVIEALQGLSVEVQICPEGLEALARSFPLVRNASTTLLGGLPMITVMHRPLDGWSWLIKRIEDMVLLALIAPLALPLCLLIALAIKLDSPGPVLFRQQRGGFNGRDFWLYKFRTMRLEACQSDGATVAAARQDPRVTRVGRLLRRISLDELPQFLNVLRGEMSVIGPRPHALSHDRQFASVITRYYARLRVRPGITGWAQVNGLRGSIEEDDHIRRRVDHDLWYIEHWSILLDLRILVLTPFVGLIHHNAY
ncbi:undecaprenyl-phosphate glucose phosphotransferase [Magnetospirillum molischianum]|uniref:Putative CPS biosynthesis glycosyltransferase n=1 Tax=Magnetospirillum molischianum DSM 120 TaxID=1150626 RepID=H8FWD1_MAGML|nr:undecaprenyl-phosphate glucose phosphotransferase [Magnetospirillum molischianum]CCG42669.1 putative CPS biosynthesis glycosyltransferase [Magnetospirillum molischianum DSM 120]